MTTDSSASLWTLCQLITTSTFEVLTTQNIKITALLEVTQCSVVRGHWCFEELYRFSLHRRKIYIIIDVTFQQTVLITLVLWFKNHFPSVSSWTLSTCVVRSPLLHDVTVRFHYPSVFSTSAKFFVGRSVVKTTISARMYSLITRARYCNWHIICFALADLAVNTTNWRPNRQLWYHSTGCKQ